MPVLQLRSQLALDTRCERQVENEIYRGTAPAGDVLQVEGLRRQYRSCVHRPVGPSRKYNCHGLSFAARRTCIIGSVEVKKIISDDEYEEVPAGEVLPGDTVVYYKDGDAEHSGIIVSTTSGQGILRIPLILSKWGKCHEVVHKLGECPYYSGSVVYYRMKS